MISEIGLRIKERLSVLGLSQRAASLRAGLPHNAVSGILHLLEKNDSGRSSVTTRSLVALAEALETTPSWLLEGSISQDRKAALYISNPDEADRAIRDLEANKVPRDLPRVFSDLPHSKHLFISVKDGAISELAPQGSLALIDYADKELLDGRIYLFRFRGVAVIRVWRSDPPRLEALQSEGEKGLYGTLMITDKDKWSITGRVVEIVRKVKGDIF